MGYCAARNCSEAYTDTELYTAAIHINCSDELNQFTNISSYLVNYLADINGGNFMLKSQVKMYTAICISLCICILLIYR